MQIEGAAAGGAGSGHVRQVGTRRNAIAIRFHALIVFTSKVSSAISAALKCGSTACHTASGTWWPAIRVKDSVHAIGINGGSSSPALPLSLVYASQRQVPLKLRAFLDFAMPRLRQRF